MVINKSIQTQSTHPQPWNNSQYPHMSPHVTHAMQEDPRVCSSLASYARPYARHAAQQYIVQCIYRFNFPTLSFSPAKAFPNAFPIDSSHVVTISGACPGRRPRAGAWTRRVTVVADSRDSKSKPLPPPTTCDCGGRGRFRETTGMENQTELRGLESLGKTLRGDVGGLKSWNADDAELWSLDLHAHVHTHTHLTRHFLFFTVLRY